MDLSGVEPHKNHYFEPHLKPDGRYLLIDALCDESNVILNVFESESFDLDILHQNRIIGDIVAPRNKMTGSIDLVTGKGGDVEYSCYSAPQVPVTGLTSFYCTVKGPFEEPNNIKMDMRRTAPNTVLNQVFTKPDGRFLMIDALYDDFNVILNVFEGTSDNIDILHQNNIIGNIVAPRNATTNSINLVTGKGGDVEYSCNYDSG